MLGAMAVSDRDRRYMERLARDLAELETDETPSEDALAAAVADADRDRRARGLPPLTRHDDPPEEEFYRHARALGLRRRRR
ncbi:MAG TPA: hypothetical protein VKI20_04835 [Acidimicrobiales bacterium]|nr:hypothetical protein [Acidimicrobiales bacterium]